LISDVILPGMSGEDLAMRLKSQYAEMKVLFMTGYDNALEMLKKFPYRALVLQKPFSVVSILPRIRSVLNDTEKSPKIEFLK
jgi:DNA-binding response OmpR family regulator